MNTRAIVWFAFASTALMTPAARAQGDRWERQVRAQLGRAAESLDPGTGRKAVTTRIGTLNTAESDSLTLTLHAGTAYVVVAACDQDCFRLSLRLSDLRSHELAADRASDHAPVVRVIPAETASYRVRIVMEICQMNPCRYGVAVITPPAP
jgi:hypothetical protein